MSGLSLVGCLLPLRFLDSGSCRDGTAGAGESYGCYFAGVQVIGRRWSLGQTSFEEERRQV